MSGMVLRAEQQLETLASFNGDNGSTPGAIVQSEDGSFYGTASGGGKSGLGTIFKIAPNQPMETVVHFDGPNGANPSPRLVVAGDGYIYGTTKAGGVHDMGTVYRLSPQGILQTIASFDHSNGSEPQSDLIVESDGSVVGCTIRGGGSDKGTVFTIGPDHQIKTLVNFSGDNGAFPQGLSRTADGKLFGSTSEGGHCDCGTVFTLNSRHEFVTVCSFENTEADVPHGHLLQSSEGNFYGTSLNGGRQNQGTIYSISPDGVVSHLEDFTPDTGAHPGPDLVEWKNGYFYMQKLFDNSRVKTTAVQWMGANFCGTTTTGGEHGNGTIFRITANGRLAPIISFTGTQGINMGSAPNSLMAGADGNLYGTTASGGPSDKGTIFRLRLPNWNSTPGAVQALRTLGLNNVTSLPVVSY